MTQYKFQIIDNAMPEHVIEKWKYHYINNIHLERTRRELGHEDEPTFLTTQFSTEDMYNVFDADSWLMPAVQKYNDKVKFKHLKRSHLNVNQSNEGVNFEGHVDISKDRAPPSSFYVSCLIFLNPEVKESHKVTNGLLLDEEIVENVFNRLVLFDGREWHKAQTPTDNLVRLTGYFSFSDVKGLREKPGSKSPPTPTVIFTDRATGEPVQPSAASIDRFQQMLKQQRLTDARSTHNSDQNPDTKNVWYR